MAGKSSAADWLAAAAATTAVLVSIAVYFQTQTLAEGQRENSRELVSLSSALEFQRDLTSFRRTATLDTLRGAIDAYQQTYGYMYVTDVPGWEKDRVKIEGDVYRQIGRLIGAARLLNSLSTTPTDSEVDRLGLVSRWQLLASISLQLGRQEEPSCGSIRLCVEMDIKNGSSCLFCSRAHFAAGLDEALAEILKSAPSDYPEAYLGRN